jgi:hypothetical protein
MIWGVAGKGIVEEFVVSSVRVDTEVLRGSCIVGETRQHCRQYRRQRQEEPRHAGSLVMDGYTNVYQTGRDGRVGGRVGSAAPLGTGGGRCWTAQAQAKQLPRAIKRRLLSL